MAIPETYTSIRRTVGDTPVRVEPSTETLPKDLGAHDVLFKIHAASLNYRDVAMLHGKYPVPVTDRGVPASDCAAEVVAVGPDVKDFKVGDHVAACFHADAAAYDEDRQLSALGGDVDGVLREYAIFEDKNVVHLPKHLSWEEGSTVACAGVTAWTSLDGLKNLSPGHSVLLEGTGGVSMFALLILAAAGINIIITSSSDEKIEGAKKLSPLVEGINYKTHPDITAEVMRITNGKGVKVVINNVGVTSIPSNIACLAPNSAISMVGFLGGMEADWNPAQLMGLLMKRSKIQGISVGSLAGFKELNAFIEDKKVSLAPLIDRTFALKESQEACDYLYSGKHVGKVIIKM